MKTCRPLFFQQTYKNWRWNTSNRHPGIQRRLKLVNEDIPDISKIKLDEKLIDNLESDPANPEGLTSKHFSDFQKIRKNVALKQIERRYFGVNKKPNMLTWSEKEQIRQLHYSEPEIWTPEKLANSFPATIDVIKKLLRAQWKPRDPSRIKKHDKAVSTNWKAFELGRLNLPENLREHFNKFTSRKKLLHSNETVKTELVERETTEGAWSSLIKKHKNISKESQNIDKTKLMVPKYTSETYVLGKSKPASQKSNLITLSQFRNVTDLTEYNEDNKLDVAFAQSSSAPNTKKNPVGTVGDADYIPSVEISNTTKKSFSYQQKDEYIPMKIIIPKHKWKKGGVFRIKNCYYNDEGRFLYKAVHWRTP